MRSIHKIRTREHRRARRRLRVRKKVVGSAGRPRLVVFRSAKHVYAQLVDDARGMTLAGASDRSEGIHIDGKGKTAKSLALGQLIAAKPKERGSTKAVFDRAGNPYHRRVTAALGRGRKGGLEL